jgi:DivIVA domain-containing protein
MFTTPQLIKDKEFESKFRGFDPIEVKEYLEIIADEFFELQEQCKELEDELESLRAAKDSSEKHNNSLETDIEFTRKISEKLKNGYAQKEEKVRELTAEVEELQLRIADMEQESADHEEELSAVEAGRKEAEQAFKAIKAVNDTLKNKIEVLREQNRDLKKEEVDFKSTLTIAQRFAEDLREKSKAKAEEMIKNAENEIARIRNEAQAELTRLPKEIQILENKKHEVKAELKAILENHLESIDVFYPEGHQTTDKRRGLSDQEDDLLFQKIEINEDGLMRPEDTAKIVASENENMAVGEQDKKVLDSLLRGDIQSSDDDLNLKEMFNLEPKGEGKSS